MDAPAAGRLGRERAALVDLNTDMQQNGLQTYATYDRPTRSATASRRTRSTTRSTTPSASAPSRPSSTRSTSTSW
jgi:hypothetical protein